MRIKYHDNLFLPLSSGRMNEVASTGGWLERIASPEDGLNGLPLQNLPSKSWGFWFS